MAYPQSPIPDAQSNLFRVSLVYFKTKGKVQGKAGECLLFEFTFLCVPNREVDVSFLLLSGINKFLFVLPFLVFPCKEKKLPLLLRFFPESSSETIDDCIRLRLRAIISFSPLKPFPLPSLVFHATTLTSGILSPFKRASVCLFVFSYGVILRRIIIPYPTITDHISYNHVTFIQIVIELSRMNK